MSNSAIEVFVRWECSPWFDDIAVKCTMWFLLSPTIYRRHSAGQPCHYAARTRKPEWCMYAAVAASTTYRAGPRGRYVVNTP